MDTITTLTTMIPSILDDKERSLFLAHRQALAADIHLSTMDTRLSPEHKLGHSRVYHRKAYDKHHDKVLAQRRACYVPTGRSIGRPRKSRKLIILNKQLVA